MIRVVDPNDPIPEGSYTLTITPKVGNLLVWIERIPLGFGVWGWKTRWLEQPDQLSE